MSSPTSTSKESDITELRSLIARDVEASNKLEARITQLRQDIEDGKPPPAKKVDLMERLAVCDLHASRLAQLRDLEFVARGVKQRAFLDPEEGPSTRAPKKEDTEELEAGRASTREANKDQSFVFVSRDHDTASSSNGSELGDNKAPSEYSDEPQIDKSSWPLLYRIMNIDPNTLSWDMDSLVKASYKKLALKHSPQVFPNDADAPALWEKITKAYNVLSDPEKRSFYDMHENVPEGLEDFDLSLIEDK